MLQSNETTTQQRYFLCKYLRCRNLAALHGHWNKCTCTSLLPLMPFFPSREKKTQPQSGSRTKHKTNTTPTKNLAADCVELDGESRTIRESCMLLHWTTLVLEEFIIHRSTIGSFISPAFSDWTIMYFFHPPTDPAALQIFSCTEQKHLKNIHTSRMQLIKRNHLSRENLSASVGFVTLPGSRTDLTENSVIELQSNQLGEKM